MAEHVGPKVPGAYRDDKWVKAAANFRKLKDKCKSEDELYLLCDQYPDLAMAYELLDQDSLDNTGRANPARYEIEARILAKESLETISKKTQVPIRTLTWFTKLFFDVMDRLNNRFYILHTVIGDSIQRGISDRDYAALWKLYAYVRGPAMLDFLITTFSDWSRPNAASVSAALYDDHKETMRRKSALAARSMGINGHTSDRLIELHTKIVEVEKAAGSLEGPSDSYNTNIQVMLSHLPFLVGQQTDENSKLLSDYNTIPAALRADELLALSAGEEPDKNKINEFKYPDPPSHTFKLNGQ